MAVVSSQNFRLTPDIVGNVNRGLLGARQMQQLQGISQQRDLKAQTQALTGQILDPMASPQQKIEAQRQLTALNPQASQQVSKGLDADTSRRLKSAALLGSTLQGKTTDEQIGILEQKLLTNEGDPNVPDSNETLEVLRLLQSGDVDKANNLINSAVDIGVRAKLISQPVSGVDTDFLKEERKTASQDVRAFNKQAKEMRTSYAKLQGLAKQAQSGDRGARNAMTVAVGRLMSPGIFTETEASALSGGQTTMQAILAAMAGKGLNIDAIQRNVDPYGDNFNVDGLLNIGSSIVASSKQPLIDMFEGSRDRATTSAMSQRAFKTNFGKNANYDFLLNFEDTGGDDLTPEEHAELQALEAKHGNR